MQSPPVEMVQEYHCGIDTFCRESGTWVVFSFMRCNNAMEAMCLAVILRYFEESGAE